MADYLPQEIEVKYVIPAIRRGFVDVLIRERGMSQRQAAGFLGLTEAAVSQYLHGKRASEVTLPKTILREIRHSIDILGESHTARDLVGQIYRVSQLPDVKKIVCNIHREHSEEFSNCEACFEQAAINVKVG